MGTIFAPTCANLTTEYHEFKVYYHAVIRQSYALASKCFENSRFRFLDDCQIILRVNLVKPDDLLDLLSMLNQINNNMIFNSLWKKVEQVYLF